MSSEQSVLTRLASAERSLGLAIKNKDAKQIDALEQRIANLKAMLEDDYDYGQFKKGGLVKKKKSIKKKYVNKVKIVDNLKKKKKK